MIVELARSGVLARMRAICGQLVWKKLAAAGEIDPGPLAPPLLLGPEEAGYSSGIAAIEGAIALGFNHLVLAGFDGSADPRSRYQGQPLYRTNPTRACVFRGWEQRMREIARAHEGRVAWTIHASATMRALWPFSCELVDLRERATAGAA